ncbi:hypothetical protein [Streptomyces sp. NPDC001568]|uniref:hypothetical protein n=1 Tax=Streptomyces sp. NPDC001568 TaxID=3364588 RepID=UPI0036783FD2
MGIDLNGFVECRWDRRLDEDDRTWHGAINHAHLYDGRSYLAFGSLFGVRDTDTFRPLADHRGLPADVSPETLADMQPWGRDAPEASWITWAELPATDWDEVAEHANGP